MSKSRAWERGRPPSPSNLSAHLENVQLLHVGVALLPVGHRLQAIRVGHLRDHARQATVGRLLFHPRVRETGLDCMQSAVAHERF
eukprot:6036204-Prymnesium_polylepis.1